MSKHTDRQKKLFDAIHSSDMPNWLALPPAWPFLPRSLGPSGIGQTPDTRQELQWYQEPSLLYLISSDSCIRGHVCQEPKRLYPDLWSRSSVLTVISMTTAAESQGCGSL